MVHFYRLSDGDRLWTVHFRQFAHSVYGCLDSRGICMGVLNDQFDLSGVGNSLDVRAHGHLLLAVFLPALIFESSFSMEWHTLSKVLTRF